MVLEIFGLLVGVVEFIGVIFSEVPGFELLVWLFDGLINGTLTTDEVATGVNSIYLAVILGILS